jgi:hypothetical protein
MGILIMGLIAVLGELLKTMDQSKNGPKSEKRMNRLVFMLSIMHEHEIDEGYQLMDSPKKYFINRLFLYAKYFMTTDPPKNPINAELTMFLSSSNIYLATFATINKIERMICDILPDFVSNNQIYILLKGGVASAISIRIRMKELGLDQSNICKTWEKGDNDIGIYIDPNLSKIAFDYVFYIVKEIVESCMLETRHLYNPNAPIGEIMLDSADYSYLPRGTSISRGADVMRTNNSVFTPSSVEYGETLNSTRYSNNTLRFYSNGDECIFDLHRLKVVFNVYGKMCTGEVLDVAISHREDSSLKKTFEMWKTKCFPIYELE